MFRTDGQSVLEAKPAEFASVVHMLVMVDLVDDQEHLLFHAAQELGQILVNSVEASLAVYDEENQVCGGHGDLGFRAHLFGKTRVDIAADTAGVNDAEGSIPQRADRIDAVAGDTGLVVDDGDLAPCKPVKKCGFPDVGSAYDCNRSAHLMSSCVKLADAPEQITNPRDEGEKPCQYHRHIQKNKTHKT